MNKRNSKLAKRLATLDRWTEDHQWVAILLSSVSAVIIVWMMWTQATSIPIVHQNGYGHKFVVDAKGNPLPIKVPVTYDLVHVR